MGNNYAHLSDEELLLFSDGELAPGRVVEVNVHLAACWECRTRRMQMEETIAAFVQAHHRTFDPQLPPIAGPRALLKARLEQAAAAGSPRAWFLPSAGALLGRTLAYLAAMLLIVTSAVVVAYRFRSTPPDRALHAVTAPVPDRRLTPGAARPMSASEVCQVSYSDDTRLVPASIQKQVFREYGMENAPSKDYELDYLISPQLGGTDDVRNLWPEPVSATPWNVHDKDALENRLQQLVCQGKLNLATAQRDLADDWISAYKRYFRTDRPIEPL
ncbi:MAG: hypothetical protein WA655_01535 [Candidatus Korobacteraceae bacterium]